MKDSFRENLKLARLGHSKSASSTFRLIASLERLLFERGVCVWNIMHRTGLVGVLYWDQL